VILAIRLPKQFWITKEAEQNMYVEEFAKETIKRSFFIVLISKHQVKADSPFIPISKKAIGNLGLLLQLLLSTRD